MGSFEFVYTEDGDQQRFSFDSRDLSIGRSPDCDFVLDHPTVSRNHARLIDEGAEGYRLIVQSEKGLTAVNGQEVSGQVRIQNGAEVYFGRLSFQFRTRGGGGDRQAGAQQGGQARGAPQRSTQSAGSSAPQQTGGPQAHQQQPGGRTQDQSAGQQGQQPPGGSQWDSYEDEVADDPVGGAGGDQTGPSSGTSQNFSPDDDDTGMTEQEELRETVGIESWDDIAESAEDEEEDPELPGENRDEDEEQTNPLLIVAAVGALGFVAWLYMSGPGFGGGAAGPGGLDMDAPPVRIDVECLAPDKCMRKAMQSYQVGVEMLNKSGAEITNLFNGYKKLLKAEAFVEKAKKDELPKEMKDLKKKKKEAREKLDSTFQNFRVKYHSAKKEGNYRAMAEALRTIQKYFPDETAREHRWARERVLQMKRKNTYPSKF